MWTKRERCPTRNSTKSGVKTKKIKKEKKKRSSSQKIREYPQILVFISNVRISTGSTEVKTKKKKQSLSKNIRYIFINFGLKPQKHTVFTAKSTKNSSCSQIFWVITSILAVTGLELHSSCTEPVNFFWAQSTLGGYNSRLGGTSSTFGGHAPECPPWRRACPSNNMVCWRNHLFYHVQ